SEQPAASTQGPASAYGSGWTFSSRYYNVSGYSDPVWSPSGTQGTAISNIYPSTDISAAAGYDGAYLFFTNDTVGQPLEKGLTVSGERLDGSTNGLAPVRPPVPPGTFIFHPKAVTLPNGTLYVLWDAILASEF